MSLVERTFEERMSRKIKRASKYPHPPEKRVAFDRATFPPLHSFVDRCAAVPGTTLFRTDDSADFVYEVLTGVVAFTNFSREGHRQIVGFGFSGDLIGASIDGMYFHNAEALSSVEVRRLARAKLPQFIRQENHLEMRLQKMMPELMTSFMEQLAILSYRKAEARTATFIEMAVKRAPARLTKNGKFTALEMTREDIGDYLGLAVETVCRGFARLEQRNAIQFADPHLVRVLDSEVLSAIRNEP